MYHWPWQAFLWMFGALYKLMVTDRLHHHTCSPVLTEITDLTNQGGMWGKNVRLCQYFSINNHRGASEYSVHTSVDPFPPPPPRRSSNQLKADVFQSHAGGVLVGPHQTVVTVKLLQQLSLVQEFNLLNPAMQKCNASLHGHPGIKR